MDTNILTDAEQALFDSLPGPPVKAVIKSTNVWIIEWLPLDDQSTGRLLHEWIQKRRPGWSKYFACSSKLDVICSIDRATQLAKKSKMIPILHFETHGNETGLGGPDGNGGLELLTWNELAESLQNLNLATCCNLVVLVAACIGYAGIKVFIRGPKAPAVALVGPDAPIMSSNLLSATKEFYRRLMDDDDPKLDKIAISASREAGTVSLKWEPFAVLAYDSFSEELIISMREDQQKVQVNRIRQRMLETNKWSTGEIERRLLNISPSLVANSTQKIWDEMFMIDICPGNRGRFGVDWCDIVDLVRSSKK